MSKLELNGHLSIKRYNEIVTLHRVLCSRGPGIIFTSAMISPATARDVNRRKVRS